MIYRLRLVLVPALVLVLVSLSLLVFAGSLPAHADEPTGECITGGACTHQCSLFCLLEDTEPEPASDDS
jgi:hypothetical protein